MVNKNTGQVRDLPLGTCDDSKGDFRLGNVRAGESFFVNYDKVVNLVNQLCRELAGKNTGAKNKKDAYELSFDAHFNLVSIHPWFDGNGRTSRLLMNFIQAFHQVPLSLVFVEDKPAYFKALTDSRERKDAAIFRIFMCLQHIKYLEIEIEKYKKQSKGFGFMF